VTIFVDEAGNADFSKGSSKTLVIGYVYARSPARTSCDVNKLRSRLCKRQHLDMPEFKFHEDSDRVKRMFLKQISKMNVICGYVAINKNAPNSHFRQHPDRLYNYLTVNYPIKRVVYDLKPDVIEYVIESIFGPERGAIALTHTSATSRVGLDSGCERAAADKGRGMRNSMLKRASKSPITCQVRHSGQRKGAIASISRSSSKSSKRGGWTHGALLGCENGDPPSTRLGPPLAASCFRGRAGNPVLLTAYDFHIVSLNPFSFLPFAQAEMTNQKLAITTAKRYISMLRHYLQPARSFTLMGDTAFPKEEG